jgi:hypothetical protein
MRKLIDLSGRRVGRLRVLYRVANNAAGDPMWRAICDCGVEKNIDGGSLRSGRTRSCGCSRIKHGHGRNGGTPEYKAWAHAKERCENPRSQKYPLYGARGVRFKFDSFQAFLSALGTRPSPQHSLDRFNDGDYAPGEVRWSTRSEQRRNQRNMAGPNEARQSIEDIRLGRELGLSQRELAVRHNVSRSFIGRLLAA